MDAQTQAEELDIEAVENAAAAEERALTMPEQARAIEISDAPSFEKAGEFLVDVKTLRKAISDHHQPVIEAAHKAHKAALAAKKSYDEPLAEAERIVKGSMTTYQREEERKRRELEAKLRAEAQKLEDERRLAKAEELEKAGNSAAAEAVIEKPVVAPAISVAPAAPKVAGVSTRKSWDFRITDESLIPREYLSVDEKKIRGVVRALGAEAKIAGVEVFERSEIAASARR